ncbi:MAG: hypothetical protein LUH63_17305 [Parabacteroides sp.]|nr:hypothetical protein [Parabacteroides sp.]
MNKSIYISLLLMVLALFSCKEDTAPEATAPDLFLEAPSDRGRSFITLNGSVSTSDQIKEVGFVVWQTGTEGGETTYKIDNFSSNRITANIKNLKAGTTYSYYMYVSNDINTKMTEEQDFTTPKTSAALVSTTSVNGNTYSAQIEDTGGSNITTKGFCWSTTGKASIFDNTVLIENTGTDIIAVIPELASAGSYSIRAFAQNEEGYLAYGAELTSINQKYSLDIPEGEFKDYLLQNFDLNHDGVISNLEAEKVEQIEISTDNIRSLDGIEYFTNLKYLSCEGGKRNSDGSWTGRGILENIDVSKNKELIKLSCSSNLLSSIDVSHNEKLQNLELFMNNLTEINLKNNKELISLNCGNNQITKIDLRENTKLVEVFLHSNLITTIDISRNLDIMIIRILSVDLLNII